MIKPWIFEFFHALSGREAEDAQKVQDHFKWYMDLWVQAEARGFEGIFFSEHHFGPAYSPSPNLLVAHVAARTQKIRLGTLGTVAAYSSPWRAVEEIGMLDHLTGGRLEIGIVKGIPPEMAAVSIGAAEAHERYLEVVEVLDKALAGGPVTHHGKYWNFDDLKLVPGRLQQAGPPKWISAISAASGQYAGRHGWKLCSGFMSAEDIGQLFDAYREAAREAGRPRGADQLGIRRRVAFVERESDVAEAKVRSKEAAAATITAVEETGLKKLLDAPPVDHSLVHDDEFIIGTPAQVTAEIIRQCKICGAGNFVAGLDGLKSWDEIAHTHEVFGRQVIPALRQADIA